MAEGVPQLLQIKKYPNRRLYDQTRSCHLTHDELYDLVVKGYTVVVTESSTGQDITNVVLMQALLDRTPVKLAAVPPELLHLVIRASESMLHSFFASYFEQLWSSFAAMQRPFAAGPGMGPAAFNPFAWMGGVTPPPPPPSPPASPAPGVGGSDEDLREQLARLSAELARLNRRMGEAGQ